MLASKHHPTGGASAHFNNQQITELISRFQTLGDPEALTGIIASTQERAKTMIRFCGTTRYLSENELLADINYKMLKAARSFDPGKGSAFTFLSSVIVNAMRTSVTKARLAATRYAELDETLIASLPAKDEKEAISTQAAIEDLAYRIRAGTRTTVTDERELNAMRWYVESFIAGSFELRRYQCADAAMSVHQLSHCRSRETT